MKIKILLAYSVASLAFTCKAANLVMEQREQMMASRQTPRPVLTIGNLHPRIMALAPLSTEDLEIIDAVPGLAQPFPSLNSEEWRRATYQTVIDSLRREYNAATLPDRKNEIFLMILNQHTEEPSEIARLSKDHFGNGLGQDSILQRECLRRADLKTLRIAASICYEQKEYATAILTIKRILESFSEEEKASYEKWLEKGVKANLMLGNPTGAKNFYEVFAKKGICGVRRSKSYSHILIETTENLLNIRDGRERAAAEEFLIQSYLEEKPILEILCKGTLNLYKAALANCKERYFVRHRHAKVRALEAKIRAVSDKANSYEGVARRLDEVASDYANRESLDQKLKAAALYEKCIALARNNLAYQRKAGLVYRDLMYFERVDINRAQEYAIRAEKYLVNYFKSSPSINDHERTAFIELIRSVYDKKYRIRYGAPMPNYLLEYKINDLIY